MRKLNISLKSKEMLSVNRIYLNNERLVYALLASKPLLYRYGRSRVAYIGTTSNGLSRVAGSAAFHADDVFDNHGVTSVLAKVITCKPRRKVKTWRKLERALILEFREIYGEVPGCNKRGKNIKPKDEFRYFNKGALRQIIKSFE